MATWAQSLRSPEVWVRDVVFTAAVALTISFLGPFGSYAEPLQDRLVRSFAFGFLAGLWIWPFMRLLRGAGVRAGFPEPFVVVAGLIAVAAPVAAISHLITRVLEGGAIADPVDPARLYFGVLTMVLPLGYGYLYLDRWIARATAPAVETAPSASRILERLPLKVRGAILALQAEDHYVRVHTDLGSHLLLMRFADAVAEVDGVEGLRVHRSWWVAKGAVRAARMEGRRAVLSLSNGIPVPVTRDAVPEIRRAGWL